MDMAQSTGEQQVELHGMISDPLILQDPNGKYYVGTLMYDAMYDQWFQNPEERLNARKHDTFSNAMTEMVLKQISGAGKLVQGQFIETR
jgi:hypothetical protein